MSTAGRLDATADGPPLAHIDRALPVAQRIYEEIRQDLFRGMLPGGRLVELELAHRYRVSRTPVRQALQRLTAAGLTEAVPSGGYVLKRTSTRDVREIFDLRVLLEPEAARLAAEHGDEKQTTALLDLARRSKGAIGAGVPEMTELNYEFHGAVADASANRPLARILRTLNERLMAHEVFSHEGPLGHTPLSDGHLRVAQAVLEHDRAGAAAAMLAHLHESHDAITAWLRDGVGPPH